MPESIERQECPECGKGSGLVHERGCPFETKKPHPSGIGYWPSYVTREQAVTVRYVRERQAGSVDQRALEVAVEKVSAPYSDFRQVATRSIETYVQECHLQTTGGQNDPE